MLLSGIYEAATKLQNTSLCSAQRASFAVQELLQAIIVPPDSQQKFLGMTYVGMTLDLIIQYLLEGYSLHEAS